MKAAKTRQECLTATVKVPAWQSKFSFPKERAVIQLPITVARARPGAPCPPAPPGGAAGLAAALAREAVHCERAVSD